MTTAAPPDAVAEAFPEAEIVTTGTEVIAGESEAWSASVVAEALLSTAGVVPAASARVDSPDTVLSASALGLASGAELDPAAVEVSSSLRELTVSVLELPVAETAAVAVPCTVIVEVKVIVSV